MEDIPKIIFNIFGTSTEYETHHGILENITYSKEGQPLTKLKGCSYIYKGYPDHRIMNLLDISKDASWIIANILRKKLILPFVVLFFILFRPWAKKVFIRAANQYFEIAWKPLKSQSFLPSEGKQYCQAMKELYRGTQVLINEVKDEAMRLVFSKFRDLIIMVLEMDTAYRFKIQDIVPTVDRENLQKNPIKELEKMLRLVQEREQCGDQKKKWDKIIRPILFFFRISRKRKQKLIQFFSLLDYGKIKIDEDDWYFCLQRQDYNYLGISFEDRVKERKSIDKRKGHDIPIIELTPYK